MPKYFVHAPGQLPGGGQPPIRNTFFEFNEESLGLTFNAATEIELQLMARLLKAGYKKMRGVYPGAHEASLRQQKTAKEQERDENQRMVDEQMAANMERLRMQREELRKDKGEEVATEESPPQSPKGSLASRGIDVASSNNTPVEARHLSVPQVESGRRLSEPQPYTGGTLGAGLDISPLRPVSGSRAIPIKDPKTKMYSTPTKAGKRTSFTASETIHEESENEGA